MKDSVIHNTDTFAIVKIYRLGNFREFKDDALV